ncbi:hypothetical protein GGTG_01135 [Gaeumannomyces tritici R3-111a-1]|uniref:Uncharacterized protein n=1 Tax=Gaeumannomyces tritici (strain R3-111a-1) TaxID=644352 RepID=J3NIQ2_GAET3|nr:hypothetical protein GGTG_01135 [Gaeumannomyces tritici R3-111a-1]EJT81151.1 hypothetical protein GGTG_01135 [Gaeumannomyces tritici R3-111a-1]
MPASYRYCGQSIMAKLKNRVNILVLSIRRKNLWPRKGARGRVYIQGLGAVPSGLALGPSHGHKPRAQAKSPSLAISFLHCALKNVPFTLLCKKIRKTKYVTWSGKKATALAEIRKSLPLTCLMPKTLLITTISVKPSWPLLKTPRS